MSVHIVYQDRLAFGERYAFYRAREQVGTIRALYLLWVARSM